MKLAVILKTVIALLMLLYVVLAGAQVYTLDTPVVASGQMPLYPDLARQAQIQGTVQVNVTTDGNVITEDDR